MLCDETFSSEESEDARVSSGDSSAIVAADSAELVMWTPAVSTMVLQDGDDFSNEDPGHQILPSSSGPSESLAKRMRFYKTRCSRLDRRCNQLRGEIVVLKQHISQQHDLCFSWRQPGCHVPIKSQMSVV